MIEVMIRQIRTLERLLGNECPLDLEKMETYELRGYLEHLREAYAVKQNPWLAVAHQGVEV